VILVESGNVLVKLYLVKNHGILIAIAIIESIDNVSGSPSTIFGVINI
jgi:hypothetical protein